MACVMMLLLLVLLFVKIAGCLCCSFCLVICWHLLVVPPPSFSPLPCKLFVENFFFRATTFCSYFFLWPKPPNSFLNFLTRPFFFHFLFNLYHFFLSLSSSILYFLTVTVSYLDFIHFLSYLYLWMGDIVTVALFSGCKQRIGHRTQTFPFICYFHRYCYLRVFFRPFKMRVYNDADVHCDRAGAVGYHPSLWLAFSSFVMTNATFSQRHSFIKLSFIVIIWLSRSTRLDFS